MQHINALKINASTALIFNKFLLQHPAQLRVQFNIKFISNN